MPSSSRALRSGQVKRRLVTNGGVVNHAVLENAYYHQGLAMTGLQGYSQALPTANRQSLSPILQRLDRLERLLGQV